MKTTSNIFGYNFICDGTYEGIADDVIRDVETKNIVFTNFITPNAHGINMYARYPRLNGFCQQSKYVLPDGQSIVWLSRVSSHKIARRLTGSDFFPVIFKKLLDKRHRVLFVVSNRELEVRFKAEKPDASFFIPDFFNMDDEKALTTIGNQLADIIFKNGINYTFIGISEPKQGALAMHITSRLKEMGYGGPCVFFFLGASFEFYFGLKKRAPLIFQKTGMEWAYRFALEPRRMFKRYAIGNLQFILRAIKWKLKKSNKQDQ